MRAVRKSDLLTVRALGTCAWYENRRRFKAIIDAWREYLVASLAKEFRQGEEDFFLDMIMSCKGSFILNSGTSGTDEGCCQVSKSSGSSPGEWRAPPELVRACFRQQQPPIVPNDRLLVFQLPS